jgi:hypothetical protein
MAKQIVKKNWKDFCDTLSREMLDWGTRVQVLDYTTGAQILNDGLPFCGLTFSSKGENSEIELMLGNCPDNHQTHNIYQPTSIIYEPGCEEHTDLLYIEGERGSKTLIKFISPLPAAIPFSAQISTLK